MTQFPKWKVYSIIFICLAALYVSLPNVVKHSLLPDNTINLGLDLRGGSYLLLEVDTKTYIKDQLDNLRNDIRNEFRGKIINGKRIRYQGGIQLHKEHISLRLNETDQIPQITSLIKEIRDDIDVTTDANNLTISFTEKALVTMKRNVLEQSIEIVRRRVDETGTREPDIQRQGDDRILLQVPGLDNPEHLKRLLGKTAKLTFHLLDANAPYPDNSRAPVAPGSVRLKAEGEDNHFTIKRQVMISGEQLVDAKPAFNTSAQPVVNIRFNNAGAKKFADITKKNVGKPFAIVLDNRVLTAPVIRSVILGGTAEISGNFTTESANDLAILLRAGSLPAPLHIIEERTVGPSLGADSIAAGEKAITLAIILVIVAMVLFYGLFGIFSTISLFSNMVLLTAALSLFQATLTLPGIAGIVLTMGMAVDANVLIFERIKEEMRLGKTTFAAVEHGFKQAFKTILDANVTTLIAAVLLYNFGSGPIKGFAVTLSIGILTSMFSAILLTRLMVISWVRKKRPETLPL